MGVWAVVTVFFIFVVFAIIILIVNYAGSGEPKSPKDSDLFRGYVGLGERRERVSVGWRQPNEGKYLNKKVRRLEKRRT